MKDLKNRIYDIIKKPHLACFSTNNLENKPWVRYVMAKASEDQKIRFCTHVQARKVAHIQKNPEVHLTCGINKLSSRRPYLQIQGLAQLDTSKEARHGFWSRMLSNIFSGPDDPNYGVIIVDPYRIEYRRSDTSAPDIWKKEIS